MMHRFSVGFSRWFLSMSRSSLQDFEGRSRCLPILSLTLVLLTILQATGLIVQAQTPPPPPPFPDVGQPSDSKPAGSRGGDCDVADDTVNRDVVPLLPTGTNGGWTTVSNPSIWVYLPFGLQSDYDAILLVEALNAGEDGNTEPEAIARQRLQMQDTQPGIHFFPFPLTDEQMPAVPASVDISGQSSLATVYRWTLKISCDELGNEPAEISGNIRRVGLDVSAHPDWSEDNPTGFSTAYVDNQVWYDALTVLGWLRLTEPGNADYTAAWQQLLSYPTVGLEAIAHEPLINCCTSEAEQ